MTEFGKTEVTLKETLPMATEKPNADFSRRDFIKSTAAAGAAVLVGGCVSGGKTEPTEQRARLKSSPDIIRVGLIGCGGRGTGAAKDCIRSSPNIEIVALGDVFQDRVDGCRKSLTDKEDKKNADVADHVKLSDDRCFAGFDAYQKVLSAGVDMVILATPPGFRPCHFKAAIEAGKHVFMEKPVATDPCGIRTVIAAAEMATQKKLAVVAGTQRRHQPSYVEAMRRIYRGDIGEVVAAQCYWNQGGLWVVEKKPEMSDMEWQIRNWLYFAWLSGDHIVEQHVHNIDVVNWAMKSPPVKCVALAGRQVRTQPEYGHIFDHFAVEYEYPSGARVLSMCRQIDGCSNRVSERLVGTKGTVYTDGNGVAEFKFFSGWSKPWKYEAPKGVDENPYVLEHRDLIASIRAGKPLNEAKRVAESTMTAIMGRMSAYTGREIQWSWAMQSKLCLVPEKCEFGPHEVPPVAVPGKETLV
jgi:predicted dehydrogenase